MKRAISIVFLSFFTIISLQSCERLKKKMEIRERRMNYLKSTIDSARNHQAKNQDTVSKSGGKLHR